MKFEDLKFEPHPLLIEHERAEWEGHSIVRGPLMGIEVYRFEDEARWAFLRPEQVEEVINERTS